MRSETVAVVCHRLRIGLFEPFSASSHLPPVATGCARLAPQMLHPRCRNRWRAKEFRATRATAVIADHLSVEKGSNRRSSFPGRATTFATALGPHQHLD